jgi:hypothetical protein
MPASMLFALGHSCFEHDLLPLKDSCRDALHRLKEDGGA